MKKHKTDKDRLEEFKKECKENPERILLAVNENPEYVLVTDGEATLSFIPPDENLGPDVFTLSLVNGGGFSSVWVTKEEWKEIKTKVDKWLEK